MVLCQNTQVNTAIQCYKQPLGQAPPSLVHSALYKLPSKTKQNKTKKQKGKGGDEIGVSPKEQNIYALFLKEGE